MRTSVKATSEMFRTVALPETAPIIRRTDDELRADPRFSSMLARYEGLGVHFPERAALNELRTGKPLVCSTFTKAGDRFCLRSQDEHGVITEELVDPIEPPKEKRTKSPKASKNVPAEPVAASETKSSAYASFMSAGAHSMETRRSHGDGSPEHKAAREEVERLKAVWVAFLDEEERAEIVHRDLKPQNSIAPEQGRLFS